MYIILYRVSSPYNGDCADIVKKRFYFLDDAKAYINNVVLPELIEQEGVYGGLEIKKFGDGQERHIAQDGSYISFEIIDVDSFEAEI